MTAKKPDCTGQKFGHLTILGRGGSHPHRGQLWRLHCDCGSFITLPRSDFDKKSGGQISCGCAKKGNGRPIQNIAGRQFGSLRVLKLTLKRDANNKPKWKTQCDCGNFYEISLSAIRRHEYYGIRINCKSRNNHPENWLEYPPTPTPYPEEAGKLLIKYLKLTEINYQQIDSEIEDEKRDRLLRAAWIITSRRQQGEEISELYEGRIIRKHLRYCSVDVFWRRKLQSNGGLLYNASNNKKEIGSTMTDLTLNDYPVIETQGIINLSANNLHFSKKLRFRRR